MLGPVVRTGVLGGVTLLLWMLVVNGLLGFQARIDMKRIQAESQVYELLKEQVTEPGRYVCNPPLTQEGRFPEGEPVFSILYGGVGHEVAGRLMWVGLLGALLTVTLGAWLLSQTSPRVLSSYPRKVLFFTALGLLFGILFGISRYGIGSYPLGDAIAWALYHVVTWSVVGLVVGWRLKPRDTAVR
jgi:hypothetical protein